ncbi:MAG: tRNA (adenosine(37)-N6)-dimethylallyltransferase MiaA [Hydrogenophilus sp.]|nr:tRNA (adenosine(37)-N6)-dimethylallyltransferase MiaA [Hydrogenophilus sp.]
MSDPSVSPPFPALLGPTASGKTALTLAIADRFPIEVISIDSALVYQGMDIGTAKPSAIERQRCLHHLIDFLPPEQTYTVGRFVTDAESILPEIALRNRIPLFVGGTMLYAKAFHEGLAPLPPANPAVRHTIDARAAESGWPALHRWLAELDPATAARLAPNDRQRIQRALEIVLTTGRPIGDLFATQRKRERFALAALLPSDRTWLARRIEERFHAMLRAGFLEEVAQLRTRPTLTAQASSMRAVGYRQAWAFLDGKIGYQEMVNAAIAATRQLAKRQLTWLRRFIREWNDVIVLDPLDPGVEQKLSQWLHRWR